MPCQYTKDQLRSSTGEPIRGRRAAEEVLRRMISRARLPCHDWSLSGCQAEWRRSRDRTGEGERGFCLDCGTRASSSGTEEVTLEYQGRGGRSSSPPPVQQPGE